MTTLVQSIQNAADSEGWPFSALMAVCLKETNGRASVGGRLTIATEGHWFYKLLPEDERADAVAAGLAWRGWRRERHPKTQAEAWRRFTAMREINDEIACQSISMGWGQPMGFNHKKLGFQTAREMFDHAQTIQGQTDLVVRYINHVNLGQSIKELAHAYNDIRTAAAHQIGKRYNGAGYRKNHYHTRLLKLELSVRSGQWKDPQAAIDDLMDLQRDLKTLGFDPGVVDGRMGPATRGAVRDFQRDRGLAVDGIPGPMTMAEIAEAIEERKDAMAPAESGLGAGLATVTAGVGTATTFADEAKSTIDSVGAGLAGVGVPPGIVGGLSLAIVAGLVIRFVYLPNTRLRNRIRSKVGLDEL